MIKRNKQLLIKLSEDEDKMVKEIREGGMNVSQLVRNSLSGYYEKITLSANASSLVGTWASSSAQLTG